MARSLYRKRARNSGHLYPCAHVCRQALVAGRAGNRGPALFPVAVRRRKYGGKSGHFGSSSSTRTCRGEDGVAEHIFRRRARSLHGRNPRNGGRGIPDRNACRRSEEGMAVPSICTISWPASTVCLHPACLLPGLPATCGCRLAAVAICLPLSASALASACVCRLALPAGYRPRPLPSPGRCRLPWRLLASVGCLLLPASVRLPCRPPSAGACCRLSEPASGQHCSQERGAMLSEMRSAVHGEKSMRCAGRCAQRGAEECRVDCRFGSRFDSK